MLRRQLNPNPLPVALCLSSSSSSCCVEHTPKLPEHSLRVERHRHHPVQALCVVACLIWLGFIEGAPLLRSVTDLFVFPPLCRSSSSCLASTFIAVGSTFCVLAGPLSSSVLNHRWVCLLVSFVFSVVCSMCLRVLRTGRRG